MAFVTEFFGPFECTLERQGINPAVLLVECNPPLFQLYGVFMDHERTQAVQGCGKGTVGHVPIRFLPQGIDDFIDRDINAPIRNNGLQQLKRSFLCLSFKMERLAVYRDKKIPKGAYYNGPRAVFYVLGWGIRC